MWNGKPGSSFFTDDPLNQKLADTYGIVMSTSHHEPMQRGMTEWRTRDAGKWSWVDNKERIVKYFEEGADRAVGHESFITIGMRGDGDVAVEGENPRKIIQSVIDEQRKILGKSYGKEDGERRKIDSTFYPLAWIMLTVLSRADRSIQGGSRALRARTGDPRGCNFTLYRRQFRKHSTFTK